MKPPAPIRMRLFVSVRRRAEDLRAKFEKYGEVRDVYLPRDYYTQ